MFIKNITIKNFRCFENENITFSTPDGKNIGSGLNILIGENGNGKTAVLEAIEYLTQSRLKTRSSISLKDFQNIKKDVAITGETDAFKVNNVYGRGKFDCDGFIFEAKAREVDSSGLVSSIVFDNKVKQTSGSSPVKPYELRLDVSMPWGTSRLPDINIVYFDKNRKRHISKGMYPSRFDDLINDLNFQILEKINSLNESVKDEKELKDKILGINDATRDILLKNVSDKFLGDALKDCANFFKHDIRLDIISNFDPFSSSFFSARNNKNLHQLPIAQLGSGTEMIFSIVFLYHYYAKGGGSLIFLIDEPELHLHPIWQSKLIEFLMRISTNTQVFISTHSPFLFKNSLSSKAGLFVFDTNKKEEIEINDARKSGWGHFPWSPSWGEINYYAYHLPTVEFHNEIYGFLQEKAGIVSITDFDTYLQKRGVKDLKKYKISSSKEDDITICTYVRNRIHHPENTLNPRYTDAELRQSTELLLGCF
ncbi:MAG: AAA family ATPase [bacterium]|nr:AAA family ATPase [bacterium]